MSAVAVKAEPVEAFSSLAELLSPLAVDQFLDLLRRREFVYRPRSNADRFAPAVGWAALQRIIAAGRQPVSRDGIRLTKQSHSIPPDRWMTDGKVDVSKLNAFLADGYSVVALRIEEHVPGLASICEEIKARTHERSYVGAIVTSGVRAGAFKTHYDPEDLLILQVEGTKRWKVFRPVVPNPVQRLPKLKLENPELIFDEVLEPGDMLFVPGGYWHHCESGLSTSVHLGIFFLPPTAWHLVEQSFKLLIEDQFFRQPLTRLNHEKALAAIEADLKKRLIAKIEGLDLKEFVARWRSEPKSSE
jgi:hypothetical protein